MTHAPEQPPGTSAPAPSPEAASNLTSAFAAFNAVSRELESSYRALEREVSRLRRELRAAEQRQAAHARRHAVLAQRLTTLIEALPGGVLLVDGEGVIEQANAAAIELLGHPLVGENWNELWHRRFTSVPARQGDLLLADGRRVSLAQKSLQPGPGKALLITDITETRKIENLLARHRRLAATGEMAAALAHQVRTPLAAALLYATNAARSELPGEQRHGLLVRAVACLQELEQLVSDMLRFARGATLNETSFTVRELLGSVENSLRPIVLPGQELEIRGPDRDVTLTGNRETLASALINLATNALNACGPDGRVQILGRNAGLQAEIIVVDNGPGIAPELHERIFKPFFTSRADGTGLGLSVARSIALAHRGEVVLVDGTAGGTTFALRLPVAGSAPASAVEPRDVAA